ncbi:hypothetical protein J4211_04085 [Candidatus Woesearchaeota archaeon]|nr:hypothetical protein [Candidatus Woesearchaeota archaeon]
MTIIAESRSDVSDKTRDERELRELEERQRDYWLRTRKFIECSKGVDPLLHEEVQRYMTVAYNSMMYTDPRTFRHGHAHLVAGLKGTTYANSDELYDKIVAAVKK